MVFLEKFRRSTAFCILAFLLFSCASYNQQASEFYSSLAKEDYVKASKNLDHNKLLQKKRNRLLYLLEKGRMEHLLAHYKNSNIFLNEADQLMEDLHITAGDIALGTLMNPMMQTYQGEDFEKYMVHYYKALNYLQLNETEEALVEARRISLRSHTQEDKYKGNHYTDDAFSLMLQGMIYEKAGALNDAFIAYRNAADLYLEHDEFYYGCPMPVQLKKDLLRLAYFNGFFDELDYYENIFQMQFDENEISRDGELILFWENGLAPVKTEQNLFFNLAKDGSGNFFFVDGAGSYHVPFDYSSGYQKDQLELNGLHSFRVCLTAYIPQQPQYRSARILLDSNVVLFETAQNINELALATLEERRLKELSKTLSRMFVKKMAEELAKPKENETSQKKKNSREALALGLKIFGFASEKADTRNWQSLPHSISYIRIPLKKGINQFQVKLDTRSGTDRTIKFKLESGGGLQFRNISTIL